MPWSTWRTGHSRLATTCKKVKWTENEIFHMPDLRTVPSVPVAVLFDGPFHSPLAILPSLFHRPHWAEWIAEWRKAIRINRRAHCLGLLFGMDGIRWFPTSHPWQKTKNEFRIFIYLIISPHFAKVHFVLDSRMNIVDVIIGQWQCDKNGHNGSQGKWDSGIHLFKGKNQMMSFYFDEPQNGMPPPWLRIPLSSSENFINLRTEWKWKWSSFWGWKWIQAFSGIRTINFAGQQKVQTDVKEEKQREGKANCLIKNCCFVCRD
jgi:hypothetical protein